jgi:hypothetical protein
MTWTWEETTEILKKLSSELDPANEEFRTLDKIKKRSAEEEQRMQELIKIRRSLREKCVFVGSVRYRLATQ